MNSSVLALFYRLKPFLPRSSQLFFRKLRAKKILKDLTFPYLHDNISKEILFPIPDGYDCVVLLTHDVETHKGLSMIESLRKIEREEKVVSTWNFVLDKYGTHQDMVRRLHDEGCECGAHGLYHDGLLFKSHSIYEERMKKIVDISADLGIKGFRSPALHRNEEWMKSLPFKWDSSFPAWDPFQPQPGGCKRYSPYKLNEKTWELPVTLFQDFTLFFELKEQGIDIWNAQAKALADRRMLINIIVHPDYMNDATLSFYHDFIRYCKENLNPWIGTPSEFCDWQEQTTETLSNEH